MKVFNWFILSWILLSFNLLADDVINTRMEITEEKTTINNNETLNASSEGYSNDITIEEDKNDRVILFKEGDLFSKTLLNWCVQEGVKCKWALDYDYKVMNSMGFEGEIKTIFNDLAIQYRNDDANLKIVYYQAIDSYYFVEAM